MEIQAGAVMLNPNWPKVASAAISDCARKNSPTEVCGMVRGMMMPVRAPVPSSRKRPNMAGMLAAMGGDNALVTFPVDMDSYRYLERRRDSVLFCIGCPCSVCNGNEAF